MMVNDTFPTKKRSAVAIEIWKAGYRFRHFAEMYGCHVSLVTQVVNGDRRSGRLEKLIADTLGIPESRLFPPPKYRRHRAA